MIHILITEPIDPVVTRELSSTCRLTLLYEQENAQQVFEADAIIVRNKVLDRDFLSRFQNLKVIAKHGTGIDNIDAAFCRDEGIAVLSAPAMNAAAVAEGVVAMMLAAVRRVPQVHAAVAAGNYSVRWQLRFPELAGKTLGVVGCGDIGTRVAKICRDGLGMQVAGYDPYRESSHFAESGIRRIENLDDLLRQSDIVSLHLPLTDQTRYTINQHNVRVLKQSAILVNASRGGVVDELALCDALNNGQLYAAALDVFESEPEVAQHLRHASNLVLSPHSAGKTRESETKVSSYIAGAVMDFFTSAQSPSGASS